MLRHGQSSKLSKPVIKSVILILVVAKSAYTSTIASSINTGIRKCVTKLRETKLNYIFCNNVFVMLTLTLIVNCVHTSFIFDC